MSTIYDSDLPQAVMFELDDYHCPFPTERDFSATPITNSWKEKSLMLTNSIVFNNCTLSPYRNPDV